MKNEREGRGTADFLLSKSVTLASYPYLGTSSLTNRGPHYIWTSIKVLAHFMIDPTSRSTRSLPFATRCCCRHTNSVVDFMSSIASRIDQLTCSTSSSRCVLYKGQVRVQVDF